LKNYKKNIKIMENCLFCKIINKEIPADIVFENDEVLAFKDINPQAPTHILIIPKKHITTTNDIDNNDKNLMGELIITAKNIAKDMGFAENGYRLNINCGNDGGQEVGHIHLHLLAGRQMTWPPG
jgi:histidine triad (HIT) family protein